MERLRVLIVGCGSIGKRHARLWRERPEAEIWLCDVLEENRQAALAHAPGARVFAEYETALAEKPDIVFICTPNRLHRPMAEAALQAGCDVLCEKPLADNLANAEAIAAAAATSFRHFYVGYSLRSHAGLRRVVELVRSGVLGTLVGGRALVGTYYTLLCATTPYRLTEPNALIFDYTHLLDYMRLLLGEAERVSAEAATLGDLPIRPGPNLFSLIVRYRSGAIGQIHMDYIQHPQRSQLEIFGDRGVLTYDFQTGLLQLFRHEQAANHAHLTEHITVARDDIYRVQIETFLQALRGKETLLATAADGVAAIHLAEAAIRAAKEGVAIAL